VEGTFPAMDELGYIFFSLFWKCRIASEDSTIEIEPSPAGEASKDKNIIPASEKNDSKLCYKPGRNSLSLK